MLRISAHSSREIQATILAVKAVPRETRAQIRKHTKQMVEPEWSRAVSENATTLLEQRMLAKTARVAVSDRNVQLKSAQLSRPISRNGSDPLRPVENWSSIEFGADQGRTVSYRSNRTSREHGRRAHDVKNRHTTRQLRRPNSRGYVIYPAAADIIPRIASLWVQTAARTIHESFERG